MIAGAASDHFFDATAFQVAGEGEERAARLNEPVGSTVSFLR